MRMKVNLKFLIGVAVLLLKQTEAQESCLEEFRLAENEAELGEVTEIDFDHLYLIANVSETLPEQSALYTITWIDDTDGEPEAPTNDNNDALAYFFYDINASDKTITVLVNQSISGLIDYDQDKNKETLILTLIFSFPALGDSQECRFQIEHDLQDENTQEPHFEEDYYEVSVREDFPAALPIPQLQLTAYDYDATKPNNEFEVSTPSDCPFEAENKEYICEEGQEVEVNFLLKDPLDYDTMEDPYEYVCIVTVKDNGNPQLETTSEITLTVTPFDDEAPAFTADFYKGSLADSVTGSEVSMTPVIEAVDQDVPPVSVTYSMTQADDEIGGDEYFAIDNETGVIGLQRDLDSELISYEQVSFILTACDESSLCSTSFCTIKLPVQNSGSFFIEFEKITYSTQIFPPSKGETILQIHAQTSEDPNDILYYFDEDSAYIDYFSLDSETGVITAAQNVTPPQTYSLVAFATVGNLTDQATVNILVVSSSGATAIMEKTFDTVMVSEKVSNSVVYTVIAEGGSFYCLDEVSPQEFSKNFEINSASGEISILNAIDVDETPSAKEIQLKVSAYFSETDCSSPDYYLITNQLERNEELLIVEITDSNDHDPTFVDPSGKVISEVLYAYPEQESLQRAVGPVATVQVEDEDIDLNTHSLTLSGSTAFSIDGDDGEIYLVDNFDCIAGDDGCHFVVTVTENNYTQDLMVQVVMLDLDFIYTLTLEDTSTAEVDAILRDISSQTDSEVYLLYANVVEEANDLKASLWTFEAHVYATYNLTLLDFESFQERLSDSGLDYKMASFSDKKDFTSEENGNGNDGFRTATIALGSILGVFILLAFTGFGYRWYATKKSKAKKRTGVQTLGQAYGNPNFKNDNNEPSFATIFGNNPMDDQVITDSTPESPSSAKGDDGNSGSSSGGNAIYAMTSASLQRSSPPETKGKTNSSEVIVHRSASRDGENESPEETRSKSSIYPSLEETRDYEKEMDKAAGSLSDEKTVKPRPPTPPPPSAPLFDYDSEEFSSTSAEKKSNLKGPINLDFDEEPKSVAFKILVDTKEIDPEDPIKDDMNSRMDI